MPPEHTLTGDAPLDLVFADAALLVVHKPAGLLCVPGRGPDKQDCLSARVQRAYPDALIVHRLDMATSGLVIMARGPAMQRQLSQAFAERQVHKRYQAVVTGQPATGNPDTKNTDWQTIDLPIIADWPNRPRRIIAATGSGQASTTRWRLLHYDAAHQRSLLDLEPVTGRTHQLRVHLQAIGHPILGDALYAPAAIANAAPRLLLHAYHLALAHPVTGDALQFHRAETDFS